MLEHGLVEAVLGCNALHVCVRSGDGPAGGAESGPGDLELAVGCWWRAAALQALSAYVMGIMGKGLAEDAAQQASTIGAVSLLLRILMAMRDRPFCERVPQTAAVAFWLIAHENVACVEAMLVLQVQHAVRCSVQLRASAQDTGCVHRLPAGAVDSSNAVTPAGGCPQPPTTGRPSQSRLHNGCRGCRTAPFRHTRQHSSLTCTRWRRQPAPQCQQQRCRCSSWGGRWQQQCRSRRCPGS